MVEMVEQRKSELAGRAEEVLELHAFQATFALEILDEKVPSLLDRVAMEQEVAFDANQLMLLPQGVQNSLHGGLVGFRFFAKLFEVKKGVRTICCPAGTENSSDPFLGTVSSAYFDHRFNQQHLITVEQRTWIDQHLVCLDASDDRRFSLP